MATILVVEDESHIAEGLAFNLEAEGHAVEVLADGAAAADRLAVDTAGLDLVILDVMLPGMTGFEIARRARAAGNYVPILMLTAKDDAADVVRGLEEGADDYLTKPFKLDELLVRTRALLRRRRWDGGAREETARSERIGSVTLRFDRFCLETADGEEQALSPREMGLLRALLDKEGEVVTRGELLETVWGLRPDTRTRVIDTFVARLRRTIEADPAKPKHILSVRGHGYRLVR